MKNNSKLEFITFVFLFFMMTGCSSLSFRQGYKLQSDKLEKPLVNSCDALEKKLHAAAIVTDMGHINIFASPRIKVQFFGPALIPLVPIIFNGFNNVRIVVSPAFKDNENKLTTDFSKWMISRDGVSWISADESFIESRGMKPESPRVTTIGNPEPKAGYSIVLTYPLEGIDIKTLYLKTAAINLGGKIVDPTTILWSTHHYTQYAPLFLLPFITTPPTFDPECGL